MSWLEKIKTFLESLGASRFDATFVGFLERFAAFSSKQGERADAAILFKYAAGFAMGAGDLIRAQTLAGEACELDGALQNQLLLALSFLRAGDITRATEIIQTFRQKNGDSAELKMAEVRIARERGDRGQAIRLLTEVMTSYPESRVAAMIQLAEMSVAENDRAGALKQLDAVLQVEAGHVPAMKMQMDILVSQGKIGQAMAVMDQIRNQFPTMIADAIQLFSDVTQPAVRNRLLAEFRNDPQAANPVVLLLVADSLAMEGKEKDVEALLSKIEQLWPETNEIICIKRAAANMRRKRPGEVPPLLQPLADRGVFNVDLYSTLADAYQALGQPEAQRKAFERGMERIPAARDMFEAALVRSLVAAKDAEEGLSYLEARERDSGIGPSCLLLKADLLNKTHREGALDLLDRLIHTQDCESLPIADLIGARILYATLLVAKDRDKAIKVLDDTVELFPKNDLAVMSTATMFAGIRDEPRLRRVLRTCQSQKASTRMRVIGLLAQVITSRQTDTNKLLEELAQNPDRIELFAAVEALLVAQDRVSEMNEIVAQMEKIAPGLVAEFAELGTRSRQELGGSIEQFRDLLRANPSVFQIRLGLAETLRVNGYLDEAISVMDETPSPLPERENLLIGWKVRALVEADRLDEAEQLIKPFLDETVGLPSELVSSIGQFLKQKGDPAAQLRFHKRVGNPLPRTNGSQQTRSHTFAASGKEGGRGSG